MLGGALANPPDGAVLLFHGSSPAAAEQLAKGDPYVLNGLVKTWRVREWTTVLGPAAEVPLPESLLGTGFVAVRTARSGGVAETRPAESVVLASDLKRASGGLRSA